MQKCGEKLRGGRNYGRMPPGNGITQNAVIIRKWGLHTYENTFNMMRRTEKE